MPKLKCKINLKNLNVQFLNDKTHNKKLSEPKKSKEVVDKSRQSNEKSQEKYKHITNRRKNYRDREHRYLTTKSEKNVRIPSRLSRARNDIHNNNNRNYVKYKTSDSFVEKRDRSRERNRDRSMRELIPDREKRRQLDHRLSDRKSAPRPRSTTSRYSQQRELQLPQYERYIRDIPDKPREIKRGDRLSEIITKTNKNTQRYNRQKDDRIYYNRSERSHCRTLNLHCEDYSKAENTYRQKHTHVNTKTLVQSPKNVHFGRNKRSLVSDEVNDSELITDGSNESSSVHSQKDVSLETQLSPSSPKRISLDDRINLVLGIEKEPPKPIDTICTRRSYAPNYDPSGYSCLDYDLYDSQLLHQSDEYIPSTYQTPPSQYYSNQMSANNTAEILQVGNLIQVVPMEQSANLQATSTSVPKPAESTTRIVKIGNRLQIVPENTTAVETSQIIRRAHTTASQKSVVLRASNYVSAERNTKKEKRKYEREVRKKRKEVETRRQFKIKTKSQIKRALKLKTGEGDLYISETNDNNLQMCWPPTSSLTTVILPRFPGKSILISYGFRNKDEPALEDSLERRKVVKFADGIYPGEGSTSLSGGEKVRSPSPTIIKMKGYTRKKNIIQQQFSDDDSSEEDNLPPPPPPPGSPPPHLWPPRVKQPLNTSMYIQHY